jgi:hypothetical protein
MSKESFALAFALLVVVGLEAIVQVIRFDMRDRVIIHFNLFLNCFYNTITIIKRKRVNNIVQNT